MTRKRFAALLAFCMLLATACAGRALADPALEEARAALPRETAYEEPEYEVVPFTTGNQVQAEDGTVLAAFNYQTVRLALHNGDAVSSGDAETAERTIGTFNEKMQSVTEELMNQGEELADYLRENYEGTGPSEYMDDAETSAVFTGDVVSVCLWRFSYTGGAHSNRYVYGWLFDLAAGQFILDPSQLADDPTVFRSEAAELLVEKADSGTPDSYWDDYQDIIRNGSGGVTLFDEAGMRVVYAPYELGPYVIGEVELRLSWEELTPLLGPGGMERLGRMEAE